MRRNIGADMLIIHSDRGAPMTSDTMASLFSKLGIERSLSRPRVSNDNAYSESQFRTLKYQSDYPIRFASLYHSKAWLETFFAWYNNEHHHVGLALFTPSEVYHGEVGKVARTRQVALDIA
jgi:putative transposase